MNAQPSQQPLREKVRAVGLAILMVTSVVAMSVSFAGIAAAEEPDPETVWEEDLDELPAEIADVDNIAHDGGEGILFVVGEDETGMSALWALDDTDRSIEWQASGDDIHPALEFNDDYVVVGDFDSQLIIDRETGSDVALVEDQDAGAVENFQAVALDDQNYLYVGGTGAVGDIDVFEITETEAIPEGVMETELSDEITGLSIDGNEVTAVDDQGEVMIHEIADRASADLGDLLGQHMVDDGTDAVERVGNDIYVNSVIGDVYGLAYDGTAGVPDDAITVEWTASDVEAPVPGPSAAANIPVDDNWVYAVDTGTGDPVALDREDGSVGWEPVDDTGIASADEDVIAAGDSDDVSLYGTEEGPDGNLWAVSDGLAGETMSSTITTSVDAPHPEVADVSLENGHDDITEAGVAQPDITHTLSIELEGELSDVDRVDVEMFRVDSEGTPTAGSPAADERYEFTIEFDGEGDATVSSQHNSDVHLDLTAVDGVDREATTDETTLELTLPEDVRPSANTEDATVNDYSWELETTPVNENIEEEEEPTTNVEDFEVGILVDATINVGEIERLDDTAFPGDDNVAHGPEGEDALELEAGGNVEINVQMSASDLEHAEGEDTISADQTKALAGQGHTYDDYDHADVTQLGTSPVDVDASALTHGEHEEFRMWIDYPEDIEPGEYSGEFTFTVSDTGAS